MHYLWFNGILVHQNNGRLQSSLSIIDGSLVWCSLSCNKHHPHLDYIFTFHIVKSFAYTYYLSMLENEGICKGGFSYLAWFMILVWGETRKEEIESRPGSSSLHKIQDLKKTVFSLFLKLKLLFGKDEDFYNFVGSSFVEFGKKQVSACSLLDPQQAL